VIDQLRAELLKIRTTRTSVGFAIGLVLLVLLFSLLGGLLEQAPSLAREDNQRNLFATGQIALFFAALVGVMLVTTEFRHGTIRPTLLYEPRRKLLVAAKLTAGGLMGLAFGVAAQALAVIVGLAVLAGRGIDLAVPHRTLASVGLGTVAATALWAMLGVAVGALVRHQVGAIVGLLAYLFIAENIVFGLVPSVGRYLPGIASQALAGETADHLLSVAAGGLLLVGYALALGLAGAVLTARRDVD